MPSVVGQTELAASNAIFAAGLLYEFTNYTTSGATAQNNGTVAAQSPAAGTQPGCGTNTTLTLYQYSEPSQFTYCPSLGYAVATSGYPGNCPGAVTCSCTPLTTTSSTQSVATSTCPSGNQYVTIRTYNQCCVTNNTVPQTTVTTPESCVPQSTECSGAACSEARCQTCSSDPNLTTSYVEDVATSICPSGRRNVNRCWTPGSCENIYTYSCVPLTQNCTPVYSYREYRSSCGATVDIYVVPSGCPNAGAESFTCPSTCTTSSPCGIPGCCPYGSGTESCGNGGTRTWCSTPSGCSNTYGPCLGESTTPTPTPVTPTPTPVTPTPTPTPPGLCDGQPGSQPFYGNQCTASDVISNFLCSGGQGCGFGSGASCFLGCFG